MTKYKTIKVLTTIFVILSFVSCSFIMPLRKYEKRLTPDIKNWYLLHSQLMESKAPKYVAKNMSERGIFLRLPTEMQYKYIKLFWKMRHEGADEEFYGRFYLAGRLFTGEGKLGWKTDRGTILMQCGYPQFIREITIFDLVFEGHSERAFQYDFDGTVYIIWEYYYRGVWVNFAFQYSNGIYHSYYGNLVGSTYQKDFIEHNKRFFAPTENGWEMVSGLLYEWLKEKDKGEK